MKKNFKYGIPLFLALSLSVIPFNVSKAETIEEKQLVTYDAPDFDQLLLDDFNNQNLEVSNYAIESEKYFDDGDDLIVEEEHVDNSESSKENLEEKDALENNTNYKVQEDNENPNKPRNKKIEEKISNMTLDEKIGQMLMLEFRNWEDENGELKEVTELNDDIKNAISKYKIGGVILFAENVRDTEQTTKLTHNIQKAAIESGLDPLLISIDQEGGIVVRLGTGTSLPGNMALGASRDKKLAYEYGKIIAEEIKALGINVNLAPVMDTNNNPNNPVIGLRSISSDPNLVGELGSEVVKGLQDNGVSAAIKYFPGHGDTATDSHLGLPVVDKSYEEVKNLELIPFDKAAKEGVDMIMTAHISYPQLEKDTVISQKDGSVIGIPATLSDDIITGIIRKKMNYDGIVITDAMKMQAIADHFGEEEAVIMAIRAGVDIPLMPALLQKNEDLLKLDSIINRIKSEIELGNISENQLNNSVYRILDLKYRRGILDLDQYNKPIEEKIENALKVVGNKEHFEKQREITDKAITVTKNINNALPMYPKKGDKVLIYTPYENEVPGFNYGFEKLQEEGIIDKDAKLDVFTFQNYKDKSKEAEEILKNYAKEYDYIIAVSEIGRANQLSKNDWLAEIPDMLTTFAKENNKKSAIISIGKPYDLDRYKNSDAHILAYGSKGMDPTEKGKDPVKTFGPNIPYSLDVVFGKVSSKGKLPVDVPELDENFEYTDKIAYEIGYGLETKLIDDDKTDSNNIGEKNPTEKPIVKEKQGNKIKTPRKASKPENPKTGISGLNEVILTLFASASSLVLSKKKNS
ncbi:glycoside hydrolase family 3 protein [Anaerococcus provencensis]|uniref:glycoside hydrolase family 3 protein n=1 Tax=Anaerococcus provencensis TaxID=938293 RepID=UPI0003085F61|nr:glycoside hydrolase family 3 protein [Anaerococcus provencensis]